MKYNRYERLYVCASCGVMMTLDEVLDRRERMRERRGSDKYEYLEWWFSKREKKGTQR